MSHAPIQLTVYLVYGLKHNLLSVSQLCDKDNLVVFSPTRCLVVNMNTGDVVLRGSDTKMFTKFVFLLFSKII